MTKTIVIEANHCPNCGKLMAGGLLAGLCPACLLAQGGTGNGEHHRQPFVPPTLDQVRKLFPQLEVVSLLGAGGMGAVYKARQPSLDRWVALKVLPAGESGGVNFAERFNREARALARLNHPNIVSVHEFGQADSLHFFIMEFVDGANLRQLEQAGRLSPREALQIIPQICDALQYAHDEGVVHRDIKPENVLVDRKGRVKIADFGLAKILGQESSGPRLTVEGQIMGTPHYMAPEQVERPLAVDHRADIYALGVVFYEMLTGDLPLGKFPPPSRKVHLDVRLDEVVLRALENDPARRYQNASEVKSQVETIAGTPAPPQFPQSSVATPRAQLLYWAGFPLVLQREGKRRINWKGAWLGLAVLFGLFTIPFAFVSAFTGRSLMGWLGIIGWPSVVARLAISALLVAYGVRRATRQKAGSGGTVIIVRRPWWRSWRVIFPALGLLMAAWALFQGRQPGSRSNKGFARSGIMISQVASRDSKTGRLVAKLPGRGIIEILAVGETNSAPGGWWAPDGAVLPDADFEIPNPVENSMSGYVSKDILIRVRDLPISASTAGIHAEPDAGVGSGGAVLRGGKPLAGAYQARLSWKPTIKTASIHLGFGLEPWKTIASISSDGHSQTQTRAPEDPNWQVNFHQDPADTAAGAEVRVVLGPESRMWLHQVIAVDTNGVKHSANNGRGTPIEKLTLWTYTFNGLRLAALKEFRVQVRPVHWVEFPDVALLPRKALPPPEPATFGPAMERSFDEIIDFDSGITRPFPYITSSREARPLSSFADNVAWMGKNGFDAAAGDRELQPLDMDFVVLRDSDWDTLDAAELMKRVYGNYYHPRVVKPEGSSATFGFRTREHGVGMLQFIDHQTGQHGVSLRYKLVQRRSVGARTKARSSGTSQSMQGLDLNEEMQNHEANVSFAGGAAELEEPPRLRFLAWQEDWIATQPNGAWRADGSDANAPAEIKLLKEVPAAGMDVSATLGGKPGPHFLHIWFSHPLINSEGLNRIVLLDTNGLPLNPGANGSAAGRAMAASERADNLGWFTATLSPGDNNEIPGKVIVRFDYAIGPLERALEVAPDFRGMMSLEGNSQLNGIGQGPDGKSFVAIAVDTRKNESRHFGVIAITRDGRELAPAGNQFGGHVGSDVRVERFEFNVSLPAVARFRIGTRPIRTREWRDVVIRPPRTI